MIFPYSSQAWNTHCIYSAICMLFQCYEKLVVICSECLQCLRDEGMNIVLCFVRGRERVAGSDSIQSAELQPTQERELPLLIIISCHRLAATLGEQQFWAATLPLWHSGKDQWSCPYGGGKQGAAAAEAPQTAIKATAAAERARGQGEMLLQHLEWARVGALYACGVLGIQECLPSPRFPTCWQEFYLRSQKLSVLTRCDFGDLE